MAILIGIDPGVNTGLAVWDADAQQFAEVTTTTIVAAMDIVLHYAGQGRAVTLYAEDARQRKWIPREASLSQFKGRAMGAGSVKRDCSIWEEFAKHHVLPLVLVPPRKGMTKWDAAYFAKVTGWTGRTSDHARDAAMLVFQRKNNQTK